MSLQRSSANAAGRRPVAVVVGATSKWQADGRNTKLAHGRPVDDGDLPVAARWGVGGAIAQRFAAEGFLAVLATRAEANAAALAAAIRGQGGASMVVELDLVSQESVAAAFRRVREEAGDPEVMVYNAGYLEGRDLPPEKELLEHVPIGVLDTALPAVSMRTSRLRAAVFSPAEECSGRFSGRVTGMPSTRRIASTPTRRSAVAAAAALTPRRPSSGARSA
jgi:NAD(P)-dependent dehydrogenase (short-subunit alcohol dehydrogenase family)